MSSEAIVGLYERHAQRYDRDRSRSMMEKAWLDRFLQHVPGGGAVLDIGCGMGEPIAAYLRASGVRVTGIDSSPSLIEMCRRREALLNANGFRVLEHRAEDPDCGRHTVWLARKS